MGGGRLSAGCCRSLFIAAVVMGGDGLGVGIFAVLGGSCAVISRRWMNDGPKIIFCWEVHTYMHEMEREKKK
jgi:hypothetical protein